LAGRTVQLSRCRSGQLDALAAYVSSGRGEPYGLRITPEGLRHFNGLLTKIRDAALAALHGPIRESPHKLGKALVGELSGLFSARRGDYRIIYSIEDTAKIVIVHRIQHRGSVYRPR
jgi:mRNA-degrading endonuclease RelE of RelBE toxin-antitoxin system